MKKIVSTIAVLLITASAFSQIQKHALIIAIGDYPSNSGWSKISSANDVPLVKGAYEKQGFTNFIIKLDQEATLKGINDAFAELGKEVKPGDIVAVHISSHGQQIYDNGNKDELDGYDEAIVTYGAKAEFSDKYTGELHLRDEDFGELIDNIRSIIGPKGDMIVTIDACHSGTGTRGVEVPRGGKKPLAPYHYKPTTTDKEEIGMFEKNYPFSRGVEESKLSPMVVISAARADELNYEYNGTGSLSLALARSMDHLDQSFSYRTLFSKILKEMSVIAPRQSPALEGDVDRILFAGQVVQQEAYYKVTELNYDVVKIDGGSFTGINDGSTFKLYPAGTIATKNATPSATGKITFADGFTATGTLDAALEGSAIEYWLFVNEKTYGDRTVWLSLSNDFSNDDKKAMVGRLGSSKLIQLASGDKNPEFELTKAANGSMSIIRKSDSSIYKDNIRSSDIAEVQKILTVYAQGKFVKELEIDNPDYNVELELIPFRMVGDKVDTLSIAGIEDNGGVPIFTEDIMAFIKITNHGNFDIYFNIIDIQPDGQINPLIPNPRKNEDPKDFKIKAGESFTLPPKNKVTFAPPYGLETFKVFASFQPINLSPIITSRGTPTGVSSPLESLFQSSYTMSRGASVGSLSSETDAATFSYLFKISPKK
jgi:hypothetical protein